MDSRFFLIARRVLLWAGSWIGFWVLDLGKVARDQAFGLWEK